MLFLHKGKKYKLISYLFFLSIASAQGLGTLDSPPRLANLEGLFVQLVYIIWGVSGLIFAVLLAFLGFQYMTSGGDAQKEEEIKKKGKNWLIGLVLVFLSYPIVLSIYKMIGIGNANSECYKSISTPGFHFFFPTVCTDPQGASTKYEVGGDIGECNNIDPAYLDENMYCDNGIILPLNENIYSTTDNSIFKCIERDADYSCKTPNIVENNVCTSNDILGVQCATELMSLPPEDKPTYRWDGINLVRIGED